MVRYGLWPSMAPHAFDRLVGNGIKLTLKNHMDRQRVNMERRASAGQPPHASQLTRWSSLGTFQTQHEEKTILILV